MCYCMLFYALLHLVARFLGKYLCIVVTIVKTKSERPENRPRVANFFAMMDLREIVVPEI